IPVPDVVSQAESATAALQDVDDDLSSDQATATVESQLPVLTGEINSRLDEDSKLLTPNASLETLRALESDWRKTGDTLSGWGRDLTARAVQLDKQRERLDQLLQTWTQTLGPAESSGAPPEIVQRVQSVIADATQTRDLLEQRRAQVLTLQNRVAQQQARVGGALSSIAQARDAALDRLFVRDSPPVWSAEVRARTGQSLVEQSRNSFSTQARALAAYAARQGVSFVIHALVFVVLLAALYRARRRVCARADEEGDLRHAARVFELPVAVAVVLSAVAAVWIYPQPPRIWWAILGAAALVPTAILLRRLVERHLLPVLSALVVFYFIDLLRSAAASIQLVSRLLFLAEMLGGILFFAWLAWARLPQVPEAERNRLWKTIKVGTRAALAVFAASLVANALGYVNFAKLLGSGALGSAYIAVILYAVVRIVDGVIMFALRVRPLASLGAVREHRALVGRRICAVLHWAATLLWLIYTLELFSLRAPLFGAVRAVLAASLTVGSLSLSLGNVIAFCLIVWAAFLLSRFIRFLLEEDVYTRVHLAPGLPYAISTMLHYAILLLGFFAAVAALGFDMTKFTILAGAFGVGLGFGLQNIVNNFVSGIIVLFERPVKVGDAIQMNYAAGVVKRIGIRASVVHMEDGSDIIVPNGKLISDNVTNWSLSIPQREIDVRVSVAKDTEPRRVLDILKAAAEHHPQVTKDPAPQALLVEFDADALKFELRAWTNHFEEWARIRSDLTLSINEALAEEHVAVK
ncbi:MAG TPA: mechanosensitive ion channel domain-containing protein, partial [Pyrinomonadaceae bacterium]|nr:mechanosensitive ion channel domain-containing protein [Pyrinomonadaceae bacterium]